MPSTDDCPNCGCSRYPDPAGHCPDCNYPPLRRLTLTGDAGSLSFGVRTRLGSDLLLRISSEAKYAEREEQFVVSCHNSDWYVAPRPGTKNATILNGAILTAESCLKNGDVIALGSHGGSGRQLMLLHVGMVDA
jgi:hypothetical protein